MEETEKDDRLHHLSRDTRGRWEMRVTLNRGKLITGEPFRMKLGKCSEAEAIRRRDRQLRTLDRTGVKVKLRKQKRKKGKR